MEVALMAHPQVAVLDLMPLAQPLEDRVLFSDY